MAYGTKDLKHITWALPVEFVETEDGWYFFMEYGQSEMQPQRFGPYPNLGVAAAYFAAISQED